MRKTLTDRAIAALKPKSNRYTVADPSLASHYVRVAPTGGKSFACVAIDPRDGRQVWATLGKTTEMKVAEARERARAAIRRIKDGLAPFEAPPAKAVTFEQVAEEWLKRHVRAKGLRSESQIVYRLRAHIYPKWKGRALIGIRRSDVTTLLDEIEDTHGAHAADHVLSVTRSIMTWYARRNDDYVPAIVRGMKRVSTKDSARDRTLTDDEIRTLWLAAEGFGGYGAMLQLLLLSAQRRQKVASMRWSDIDADGIWTIPTAPREKGNAQLLKLPALALEIIHKQSRVGGNVHVFAGRGDSHAKTYSPSKRALDALLGDAVKPWRLHDLRRTARSLLSRVGVLPNVAERVLGHVQPGVAGTYDRHQYFAEKADALARLAALIASLVDPKDNVLLLTKASGQPRRT